eukprot:CAMPEP_0174696680 /NCGR_PEP_ID=MMETSP1094-20130205/2765_1 /TAXON_ID=156173 /ORGANISM="Chrysochromulina brevifilum, Strain UTEX LB 985" /LENGTH=197 /DNA_ID=CAMNT_0015893507 /DNA_START=60 /DNA_END=653 /DNA_ORIENTATION=+
MRPIIRNLLLVGLAWGTEFHLQGKDSFIAIGPEGSRAFLYSGCETPAAVQWIAPQSFETVEDPWPHGGGDVSLYMSNVPYTCAESSINEPCAPFTGEEDYPALFFCHFTGSGGNTTVGPLQASSNFTYHPNGAFQSGSVFVSCPLPAYSEFQRVSQYEGPDGYAEATVTLTHGAIPLDFQGFSNDNVIAFGTPPTPT